MPYTSPTGGTRTSTPKPGPTPGPAPIHSWRQPTGGVRPAPSST
jgi:hypothetical protein